MGVKLEAEKDESSSSSTEIEQEDAIVKNEPLLEDEIPESLGEPSSMTFHISWKDAPVKLEVDQSLEDEQDDIDMLVKEEPSLEIEDYGSDSDTLESLKE